MSVTLQFLIGIICGLVFGFFTMAGVINQKEKELKSSWAALASALNMRYLKLKNVLNFLHRHMNEFYSEIDELISILDENIENTPDVNNVSKAILAENSINYKLESIKSNMSRYPSIQEDEELNAAIIAIAESESYVGEAIRVYNAKHLEYSAFIDTFPVSVVAWILNKNSEIIPFSIQSIEEFDDSYIDEDEI